MKLRYLPWPIVECSLDGQTTRAFPAAALSLDLVGFTRMCEALLPMGPLGEETLSQELEALFSPLVRAVESREGFIADYAGDACVAVFPNLDDESPEQIMQWAWLAAREVLAWLNERGHRSTPAGEFVITARVGIAYGDVQTSIVEVAPGAMAVGSGRQGFFCSGSAITRSTLAQSAGFAGEVNLDRASPRPVAGREPRRQSIPIPTESTLRRFVPDALIDAEPRGESRRIATLFGRLSAEPTEEELTQLFAILAEGERAFGGYHGGVHYDPSGWGFILFFGAPEAHEDDLQRALECALFLKYRLTESNLPPVRFGINFGEAYAGLTGGAGRVTYTCLGDAVNLAERVSRPAEPGSILCTRSVLDRAPKFEFASAGCHTLKGKTEPVEVWSLIRRKTALAGVSYSGTFCGRREELGELRAAVDPIFAGKNGGIIRVLGTAGTGKSRLLYELRRMLEREGREFRWVFLPSDPITRNPFNPLLAFLKAHFPFTEFGTGDSWRARFGLALEEYCRNPKLLEGNRGELRRTISVLGGFLGGNWEGTLFGDLDARGRKENFMQGMKALFKAEADIAPTVIEIEDAQWLDDETRNWLGTLMRHVAEVPFIVITTERPTGGSEPESLIPNGVEFERRLALDNLSRGGLSELVRAELGGPPEEGLLDFLWSQTEGNPFFAEQYCRHLRDTTSLRRSPEGIRLVAPPGSLPPDAESMLIARIDAMGARVKDLLQRASILGTRFTVRILERMLESSGSFMSALRQAEQQGAILQDDAVELTEVHYLFRHLLLRDAAYEMQLPGSRRSLHLLALNLFETLYPGDRLGPHYEEMSFHAERGEAAEKYLEYLTKAADHAAGTYLNKKALALLDRLLEQDIEWLERVKRMIQKADILSLIGQPQAGIDCLYEAIERSDPRHPEEVAHVWDSLGAIYVHRDEHTEARKCLEKALDIYRVTRDEHGIGIVENNLGISDYRKGDLETALRHFQTALEMQTKVGNRKLVGSALNNIGLVLHSQRRYDQAMDYYQQAYAVHQETRNRRSEAIALGNIGVIRKQRGEVDEALAIQTQVLELNRGIGYLDGQGLALLNLGIAHTLRGELADASSYLNRALHVFRETGDRMNQCAVLSNLANVAIKQQESELAITSLRDALTLARGIGDIQSQAAVLFNLGGYLGTIGQTVGGIEALTEAAELSERMGCHDALAEVLVSLAELQFCHAENALGGETSLVRAWHLLRNEGDPETLDAVKTLAAKHQVFLAAE